MEQTQRKKNEQRQMIIGIIIVAVIFIPVIISAVIFGLRTGNSAGSGNETQSQTTPDDQDPQAPITGETGNAQLPEDGVGSAEVCAVGIDVSKYQGVIDWEQVAGSGVDFAMIRVGYRAKISGEITADSTAKYNIQQALKYGINVGVYFFSTAISEEEAAEEARWVADYVQDYTITYPVAYNCEDFNDPENRQYELTRGERTDIALRFLEEVDNLGYTPMFYASKSEMQGNSQWDTSRIDDNYLIWVANYPSVPYPETESSSYTGVHAMWQYTASGTVPGISGTTDLNVAYFAVEKNPDATVDTEMEDETIPWDDLMDFEPVNEEVTAKDSTNLRDIPSQDDGSTVLYTLTNGEIATRVGISDKGWSKLEFNGNIYYAVSNYLTTDLTPPPYEVQTPFENVSDQVTAKEVVNLRTLPSLTHEESEVVAQLHYGEVITRTGINNDVGWSRVEYNGQTLYCITQYLMSAEDIQEETTDTSDISEETEASEPTE